MIIVSYAKLIEDPKTTLMNIGAWSGLGRNPEAIDAFLSNFFEKGLRHHEADPLELQKATLDIPYVFDLYQRLDALAKMETFSRRDIQEIIDAHRDSFAELLQFSFLGRLFSVSKRNWIHQRHMRQQKK